MEFRKLGLLALVGALAVHGCSSSSADPPAWHVVATTLAFPGRPAALTFAPDDGRVLVVTGAGLYELNPGANPNLPEVFRPFNPAPPADTTIPWRGDDGTLWVQGVLSAYRLRRGASSWERVDGDPNAVNMVAFREASNGTLYSQCEYATEGWRVCFKKGAAPWQAGDKTEPPLQDAPWFSDHAGGMIVGLDVERMMHVVDGVATVQPIKIEHTKLGTKAIANVAGVTREGNTIWGTSNYGGAEHFLIEIRPDGLGRSWVDQGCVQMYGYAGPECTNGVFNQVWSVAPPVLSRSGAAYQIWSSQNGAIDGALMRARPNGTKWEAIAEANPFQEPIPLLFPSPTSDKLYELALGPGNAAIYEMDLPVLP